MKARFSLLAGQMGIGFRGRLVTLAEALKTPSLVSGIVLVMLLPLFLLARALRVRRRSAREEVFSVLVLISVLVVLEALSAVFFLSFREQFTFFEVEQYLLSRELQDEKKARIESTGEGYLALGWDNTFPTPLGERPRTVSYDLPFMSTFGDSFTYCDDVEDHETWQSYLANLLKKDVYNFGVASYGTDQAYLKFRSVFPSIRTPVVALGLTTENINRIVNVYRPFYFPRTGNPSTKPRFVLRAGELVLLDNPIQRNADVRKLGDARFVQGLGRNDWWYNRDDYPVLQFPYSRILFNKRMWLEAYYGRADRRVDDIDPRPWANLWEVDEARNLMLAILDAFVGHVKEKGAVPIIVVLPLKYQVRLEFLGRPDQKRLARLLEACEKRGYRCFNGIAPLAKSVTAVSQINKLFVGHVSAKGNRIIAEALLEYLQGEVPELIGRPCPAGGSPPRKPGPAAINLRPGCRETASG